MISPIATSTSVRYAANTEREMTRTIHAPPEITVPRMTAVNAGIFCVRTFRSFFSELRFARIRCFQRASPASMHAG